eukprot:159820-Chlamydomonas_euryale.AAC.6
MRPAAVPYTKCPVVESSGSDATEVPQPADERASSGGRANDATPTRVCVCASRIGGAALLVTAVLGTPDDGGNDGGRPGGGDSAAATAAAAPALACSVEKKLTWRLRLCIASRPSGVRARSGDVTTAVAAASIAASARRAAAAASRVRRLPARVSAAACAGDSCRRRGDAADVAAKATLLPTLSALAS